MMAEEKEKRKMADRRPTAQRVKRVHPDGAEQAVDLEPLREKIAALHQRHADLRQALGNSRTAQGAKLSEEFDAARANGPAGELLQDSAWNDSLWQTVFEQANAETETNNVRVLYYGIRKSIFILSNRRVGVQFTPTWQGQAQESYYCVMSMKPPSEKILLSKSNIPFFLRLRELETTHLALSPTAFLDQVNNQLQAFVSRREQIVCLKQQHGEHIGELYHSLAYDSVKFALNHSNFNSEVELGFELESQYPTRAIVNVWVVALVHQRNVGRRGPKSYTSSSQVLPRRVPLAEDVLKNSMLPEAFEDVVREMHALASVPTEFEY